MFDFSIGDFERQKKIPRGNILYSFQWCNVNILYDQFYENGGDANVEPNKMNHRLYFAFNEELVIFPCFKSFNNKVEFW